MNVTLAFLVIEVAVVVCAALVAVRALTRAPQAHGAWLTALIALNTAAGVVLEHHEYGYWIGAAYRIDVGPLAGVLNLARNATPGLLMLLCHALFADGRRFPRGLSALFVLQLLMEGPVGVLVPPDLSLPHLATRIAPALLQTLFIAAALYWTIAGWRADLVETRRGTRAFVLVAVAGLTGASVLATRVLIDPDSVASYYAHLVVVAADLFVLLVVLFRLMGDDADRYVDPVREPRLRASKVQAEAPAALARLRSLLDQGVCRDPHLTLATLAEQVGLPEYRLRRLIHEELGYRNFNALLHDYRVREACAALADPQQRRTPILTIALTVGYASVNTFNRGFREVTGVNPSAWRAGRLKAE